MATIQEVITQMYNVGESKERIQAVIDAYKKNKAKDAEAQDQAKRIASYLKPAPAPKVLKEEEKVVEEVKGVETKTPPPAGTNQEPTQNVELPTTVSDNTTVNPNANIPVVEENPNTEVNEQRDGFVDDFFSEEGTEKRNKEEERIATELAPNISYEALTDTDFFGDKESQMVSNLSKHYANDDLKFEVLDEWGSDDKIKVTNANGRTITIDTNSNIWNDNPEMIMSRLSSFVDQSRKDGDVKELTNAETDEMTMSLPTHNNSTATEGTDAKILGLEKDIAALPMASSDRAEKEKELANYTHDKREDEFDQTSVKTAKKADKYNEELKGKLDQHASFMKSEGIEEGSPEWKEGLDRVMVIQ